MGLWYTATTEVKHIKAAERILLAVVVIAGIVSILLVVGGIYLAIHEVAAPIKFRLFGNELISTSVGIGAAFLGILMSVLIIRKVLDTVVHLGKIRDTFSRSKH
jgi:hypothetical protein